MLGYVVRRLIMTVVVIVLIMVFLGALVHLIPGDPVQLMLRSPHPTPQLVAQVRAELEAAAAAQVDTVLEQECQ